MQRVPPVVVGPVELAKYLLGALGRQVAQPRQVRPGIGEVAALLGGPDAVTTLAPGETALVKCQVPHRTAGMSPASQPFCLPRGRIGAVPPPRVSVHRKQYPSSKRQDEDNAPIGAVSWR
jgi:hypothetical protein